MHAVVNHLRLASSAPTDLWARAQAELPPLASRIPGFQALHVIALSETEVVLVVLADSAATLDRVADEVGNAWMRENVIPHLAGPPDRRIGEVVVSTGA